MTNNVIPFSLPSFTSGDKEGLCRALRSLERQLNDRPLRPWIVKGLAGELKNRLIPTEKRTPETWYVDAYVSYFEILYVDNKKDIFRVNVGGIAFTKLICHEHLRLLEIPQHIFSSITHDDIISLVKNNISF